MSTGGGAAGNLFLFQDSQDGAPYLICGVNDVLPYYIKTYSSWAL